MFHRTIVHYPQGRSKTGAPVGRVRRTAKLFRPIALVLLLGIGFLLALPAHAQDQWLWGHDWNSQGIGNKTLQIKSGKHGSSNVGGPRRIQITDSDSVARSFQSRIRFHYSARYDDPNGQYNHWNKLLKTASQPNSDKNSVRLGWRWDAGQNRMDLAIYLHLSDGLWNSGPFWNTDGTYWVPSIATTPVDRWTDLELGLSSRAIWITVEEEAWVIKNDIRDMGNINTSDWSTAHQRNAYFGGEATAPHTLKIDTQNNVLDAQPRMLTARHRKYIHSEWFDGEVDYVLAPASITAPAQSLYSKGMGQSLPPRARIHSGAHVTFASRGPIVLKPGFSVEQGATFIAKKVPGFEPADFGYRAWYSDLSEPMTGDFDGDDKWDIAYHGTCGNPGKGCWRVHLSNGKKFTPNNFGDSAWFTPLSRPIAGDFDNNDRWDIAYHGTCGNPGKSCWRVHLSDGTKFTPNNFGDSAWFTPLSKPLAGDFDGDKRWDIAYHGTCGNPGKPCWRVHLSDGKKFTPNNFGNDAWFTPLSKPIAGDFDGNKKWDIAYHGTCGNPGKPCWRVHLSDGKKFTPNNFGNDAWFTKQSRPIAGDFDGNGKWDIAYHGTCGDPARPCWRVHLSDGTSFAAHSFGDDAWFSKRSRPMTGDFDGDSRSDIVYDGICGEGSGHACWRVHLSK